jgi:8-amino-7-oxononanoate synthase
MNATMNGRVGEGRALPGTGESLLGRLRSHAQARPEQIAYRFLHDHHTDTLTFGQLERRVSGLAARLREHADPRDRALLLYPSGLAFIESFLACLAAGIIAVPAYPPRKNRKGERPRAIIHDCRPRLILTTRQSLPTIMADEEAVRGLTCLATDDLETTPDERRLSLDLVDAPAFLQYTSGSTCAPRGIIVTRRNLLANLRAIQASAGLSVNTVNVSWLPLFHDMGLVGGILSSLFVGFELVLMAPSTLLREPVRWLAAISAHRATCAVGPNFAYEHCVRTVTDDQKQGLDLSTWSLAFNGAEPIRPETLDRFATAFAPCGFRREAFFPCYGLAEATLMVSGGPPCSALPREVFLDGHCLEQGVVQQQAQQAARHDREVRRLVGCGAPVQGTRIEIVDPATRTRCPHGKVGEILVMGGGVAQGYWNRPEESATTFAAQLADTGDGPFLRTGDAGFLLDGQLFIVGRLKDLIIIRGRNLCPQDVEAAVERVVDFLTPNRCAAFAVESEGGGGSEERLAIVLEASRNAGRTAQSLRAHIARIRAAIVDEFEVPVETVAFVRFGTFPCTSSGKVQRRACKAGLLAGTLDVVYRWSAGEQNTEPPAREGAGRAEDLVRSCLLRWLSREGNAAPAELDGDTPFTALGLDSVGTAALALEVEKASGVRLSADLFCELRTINAVARHLESRTPPSSGQPATATALTFRQQLQKRNERMERLQATGRYCYQTEFTRHAGARSEVGDTSTLMLSSFGYLGLIGHPEINEAATAAIARYGAGCHGARLVAGTTDLHRDLERQLAAFLSADDALVYSSGYTANLSTIAALVGPGDRVIGDERNHTSVVDGCKLSGAACLTFRHNDVDHLRSLLEESPGTRTLVVVEGGYSMEGDIAPLPEIVDLCQRHGAVLMVDEAHSLGVLGKTGRGVQEHFGLPADAIDVKMGTLSKALGSQGGFIAGSVELIDYLKHHAHTFVFSASLAPPLAAAALKALEVLRREPWRVERLQHNARRLTSGLRSLGLPTTESRSAIVGLLCPTEEAALEMTVRCRQEGLYVVPMLYPAVPRNAPRLRLNVMATHTDEDVDWAIAVLARAAHATRQS